MVADKFAAKVEGTSLHNLSTPNTMVRTANETPVVIADPMAYRKSLVPRGV